ncbi:hypothetical protein CF319_g8231 [Tilletia indica]|nr:hypothetical protein CF319_g8231 [Tilletia indica]
MGANVSDDGEAISPRDCRAWARTALSTAEGAKSGAHPERKHEVSGSGGGGRPNQRLKLDEASIAALERRRLKQPRLISKTKADSYSMRRFSMRIYPSKQLSAKLREWIVQAGQIREHTLNLLQTAMEKGETIERFVLADKVVLSHAQ